MQKKSRPDIGRPLFFESERSEHQFALAPRPLLHSFHFLFAPPQRGTLSTESQHSERYGLRLVGNWSSHGSIGAEILNGRIVRRLFGLTRFDRLVGDGFIGI